MRGDGGWSPTPSFSCLPPLNLRGRGSVEGRLWASPPRLALKGPLQVVSPYWTSELTFLSVSVLIGKTG